MLIALPQQYLVRQELINAKYGRAIANNPIEPVVPLGVWLRALQAVRTQDDPSKPASTSEHGA